MMQFIVISHSESGPLVEEFETKAKAVDFAEAVASDGMPSTILMRISEIPAVLPGTRRLRRSPRHRLPRNPAPRLVSRLAPHLPRIPGAGNGIGTNRISIMEDTWKLQQSEILVTDTKYS